MIRFFHATLHQANLARLGCCSSGRDGGLRQVSCSLASAKRKASAPRDKRKAWKESRIGAVLCLWLAFFAASNTFARAETSVDVALVLAIDGSGSVEGIEFHLQTTGIAHAFRSPEIMHAIRLGHSQRISVTYVFWGDADLPSYSGQWRIIETVADAHAFAAELESQQRRTMGYTGIGPGVVDALLAFGNLPFRAERRVIDVSGDGKETVFHHVTGSVRKRSPASAAQAADLAEAQGITINGLAILTSEADLAEWYLANVVTSSGSFVMSVKNFDGFASAIKRKLLREIGLLETSGMQR